MNDQSIYKSLTLNIQTQNYDMNLRSRNILIVYRVYYKVMTSIVNPNCFFVTTKKYPRIFIIILLYILGINRTKLGFFFSGIC